MVDTRLTVIPSTDKVPRGVFATRAPVRPSRLGLSIVDLLEVDENRLTVREVDILDNTPLIDIKPYITAFDCPTNAYTGWMAAARTEVGSKRADDRFTVPQDETKK